MNKLLLILSLTVLLFSFMIERTVAVPAYPHPIEYIQPDGSIITILLKGDEKVNWAETLDGYTILVNSEGEYQYAIHNEDGDLVFSGIAVSEIEKRSPEETGFLEKLEKGLFYSEKQVKMLKQVWEIKEQGKKKAFPTTGNQTMLCILMEAQDVTFTKTQADFNALFNQLNYTVDGATGSFKEFYLENSYGQLNVTVDVIGPYKGSQNMSNYASDARELLREGVYLADSDVNYADYDMTGDGIVDALYMIFAGYGQEATGNPNHIWSHAWALWPAEELDGVYLYRYACSPELRGSSGTGLSRIGVIVHEFGHSLGAPDFYDTNYATGGQFSGTGMWDVMASGAWNNGGATPPHHNAFTKTRFYNWATATVLNSPASITLNNAAENDDSFYRYNTTTTNEYFLLENREQHLFDSYIPGSGMIIYHVHSGVMTSASNNTVNTTHPQRMYPVAQNAFTDPNSDPASYGNINSPTCAWTGSGTSKTEFSDISIPSSKSWAGNNTNKPITSISRNAANKTVSFEFMGGDEEVFDTPTDLEANIIDGVNVGLSWTAPESSEFGSPQWAYYANIDDLTHINWPTPERATLFNMADFGLSYPAEISRLLHVFFEHGSYLWPNDKFRFKVYDTNGSTLLYESAELTALHYTEFSYELQDPIVVSGNFYVAIAPVDASGHPSTTSMAVAPGTTNSYSGSSGSWTLYDGYEFITAVYLAGGAKLSYNPAITNNIKSVKTINDVDNSTVAKLSREDLIRNKSSKAVLTGFKVFRNDAVIATITNPETTIYLDEGLDNGNYQYYVTATYSSPTGESDPSNIATIDITANVFTVDFTVTGGNGGISASVGGSPITSGDEVPQGSNIVFTASPNSGYKVKEWKVNGSIQSGQTSNTFNYNNLQGNIDVTVEFELIQYYEVTFSVIGNNGDISASVGGSPVTSGENIAEGSNIVFTATPNSGYKVKEWKVNGSIQSGQTSNTFNYNNLQNDINVIVEFMLATNINDIISEKITVSPNPFANYVRINNISEIYVIHIYNIVGQKIMEIKNQSAESLTINTSHLNKGIYIMAMESIKGERIIKKLIRE